MRDAANRSSRRCFKRVTGLSKLNLGIVVGSNRRASINRGLAIAMARMLSDTMEAAFIEIAELPMYSLDLEEDRPVVVRQFTAEVSSCDALLVVTPEYNRSIPAVLKNAIDWGSKPMDSNVWRDKVVAICGTSPSPIGTAFAQQHLRQILGILGSLVLGGEAYISYSAELFDTEGDIAIPGTRSFLQAYLDRFEDLARRVG